MKQSELFTKTLREAPKDEEALNAKLLIRGGFVEKVMAGVYTFLPLGLRVLEKIENVIREEVNAIGGQEVLMPALQPKENWMTTGRWEGFDALYKVISHFDTQYALGPTHEEMVVPLAKKFLHSYRDLPFAIYQIQTKFRDEARPKSGLLRGREFRMKDLYSFHMNQKDLLAYYARAQKAYAKIFKRLGLRALMVEASGGSFSKYSHEFQVLTPSGEDVIYHCVQKGKGCGFSKNKEVVDAELARFGPGETTKCPSCGGILAVDAGVEVGNIFQLNTKFSQPFGLMYKDEAGKEQTVVMGCYGIGVSRLLGVTAEVMNDDRGLIWPEAVAPFMLHLIELPGGSGKDVYARLQKSGVEVLYDERSVSTGEKFADADLLGIPWRAVISKKTGTNIELKKRGRTKATLITLAHFFKQFS